jgi:hypothetical protein
LSYQSISFDLCFKKKKVKKEKVVVTSPFQSRLLLQLIVFLESLVQIQVAKQITKINKCFVMTILIFLLMWVGTSVGWLLPFDLVINLGMDPGTK